MKDEIVALMERAVNSPQIIDLSYTLEPQMPVIN